MANPDRPRGLIPIRRMDGAPMVVARKEISSSNAAIGLYDPIHNASDGYAEVATATSQQIIGIAAEAKDANSGGTIAYHPAQGLVFIAQVDDATVNQQTDLNLNYSLTVGTRDSNTKQSTFEIDGSAQATTPTLPVRPIKVADVKYNAGGTNDLGANVVLECVFNETAFNGGATGV